MTAPQNPNPIDDSMAARAAPPGPASLAAAEADRPQPAHVFLASGAVLLLIGAVALALQPQAELRTVHLGLAAGCLVMSALFAWWSQPAVAGSADDRVLAAGLGGVLLALAMAWFLGLGLRTALLGAAPLMVGLVTLLAGGWRAALVACIALAGLLALTWAGSSAAGHAAQMQALGRMTPYSALWAHLVLLAGGVACGLVGRRLAGRWRDIAEDRERHFRELLAEAADLYFELDEELRFVRPAGIAPHPLPDSFAGFKPWGAPGLGMDADTLEQLVDDLMARRPFEAMVTLQRDVSSPAARLAIRGRPRWSDAGRFVGYWGVGRDVTAQARQHEATRQALADAEAASRAKTAFLANVSHEIRTPLNGLVGLAGLARQEGIDEHRRREYVELMADAADTVTAIISDILDLSKIEAGRLEIRPAPTNLHDLLARLERSYRALARAAGLSVTMHRHPALPVHVRIDAVRLRQILANYLNNALKFTSRGSIHLMALPAVGDRLRFEVHDTGPGIAEADRDRLFQPFSQLDDPPERRFRGTGLGLAICRELASLMGGEVGVDSRRGEGSRFWLELPAPACAAPAARAAEAGSVSGSLDGLVAVVAEDNPVNMLIAVSLLESWGMTVLQAGDGREAVDTALAARLRGDGPDVVLMDLNMPRLGGAQAAGEMRQAGIEAPVIALTALALASEPGRLADKGIAEVVAKPFDALQLQATLLRHARPRRSGDASAPDGASAAR